MIGMDGEKESGKSMLSTFLSDDDILLIIKQDNNSQLRVSYFDRQVI